MSLCGQAINLFVLGLTLVETHCPSVAIAITLTLQAAAWRQYDPDLLPSCPPESSLSDPRLPSP